MVGPRSHALLSDPDARRWLGLALAVLVVAGLFALLLVLGRMPPFDLLVPDPQFFRRCLVVHVDLALVLWFQSFLAVLLFRLPARPAGAGLARASVWLAAAGLLLLTLAPWLPATQPVMSNYVPMIDHWLFGLGLACFAAAVAAVALSRRLLPGDADDGGVLTGLRTAVVGLCVAVVTLLSTWLGVPGGLDAKSHYELLFWGGGHVLQLVSATTMVVAWLLLAGGLGGRPASSRRVATAGFALLLLPWLVAPLLPLSGAWSSAYRTGFTRLMQLGMLPVLGFLVLLLPRLRWREIPRDPRPAALATSMLLTVAGMAIGAMIRGSSTVIPAHYHASIGAVTVAFMGVTYTLLRLPARRLHAWTPLVYGIGQLTFAVGFGLAGAHGAARKVYGAEQSGRSLAETIGLVVMGVGGLVAVAGGLLFLFASVRALLALRAVPRHTIDPWMSPSTPSRS